MEALLKRADLCDFVFETLKDGAGVYGLSLSFVDASGRLDHHVVSRDCVSDFDVFVKRVFDSRRTKICFDMRDVLRLGLHFKKFCDVIDVSSLYGHRRFDEIVRSTIDDSKAMTYVRERERLESHFRACALTKIDLSRHSIVDIVSMKTIEKAHRAKNEIVYELFGRSNDIDWFVDVGYDRARVLYEIETHLIRVDVDADVEDTMNDTSFMRHVRDNERDGFVEAVFTPQRSKTGRVQTAKGSFRCMGIPRSTVRRALISRFDGGSIASFDFNAADYRCIVAATGNDELIDLYDDCDDFHTRTVELIFGDGESTPTRRRVVKNLTYMLLYGGSKKNVSKTTGLSTSLIDSVVEKMSFMEPIHDFREKIHRESLERGYITTPHGMIVRMTGDEHSGKTLALYAQTCTNDAFMDALVNVHDALTRMKSLELFTVHDELVIDVHPDEIDRLDDLRDLIELGSAKVFGVKIATHVEHGPNYWDMK